MDSVTRLIRFARPLAYCVLGAEENDRDPADQRPASTHDTGMISSDAAVTRMLRLTFEEIEEARERYKPGLKFDVPRMTVEPPPQRKLPIKSRTWKAS
jgi:hypothetical protein